jgi:hypothetical protein
MAILGSVLSGIVQDLVEARLLADRLAAEARRLTAGDPLLSAFPSPRLGIKEVNLKLRFAVDGIAASAPAPGSDAALAGLWRNTLSQALPKALQAAGSRATGPDLKRLADSLAEAALPARAGQILTGGGAPLRKASEDLLLAAIKALPAETRKRMPGVQAIRSAAAEILAKPLEAASAQARNLAKTTSRLDVLLGRADLAKVPENNIQECTFTFSLEDVEIVGDAGGA